MGRKSQKIKSQIPKREAPHSKIEEGKSKNKIPNSKKSCTP